MCEYLSRWFPDPDKSPFSDGAEFLGNWGPAFYADDHIKILGDIHSLLRTPNIPVDQFSKLVHRKFNNQSEVLQFLDRLSRIILQQNDDEEKIREILHTGITETGRKFVESCERTGVGFKFNRCAPEFVEGRYQQYVDIYFYDLHDIDNADALPLNRTHLPLYRNAELKSISQISRELEKSISAFLGKHERGKKFQKLQLVKNYLAGAFLLLVLIGSGVLLFLSADL